MLFTLSTCGVLLKESSQPLQMKPLKWQKLVLQRPSIPLVTAVSNTNYLISKTSAIRRESEKNTLCKYRNAESNIINIKYMQIFKYPVGDCVVRLMTQNCFGAKMAGSRTKTTSFYLKIRFRVLRWSIKKLIRKHLVWMSKFIQTFSG